jgi:hypothetical protein
MVRRPKVPLEPLRRIGLGIVVALFVALIALAVLNAVNR